VLDRMTRLLHIERSESFVPVTGGYSLLRECSRGNDPSTLTSS
jgi:hypothetical protein